MATVLNKMDVTLQANSSFSTANSSGVGLPSELCGRSEQHVDATLIIALFLVGCLNPAKRVRETEPPGGSL
jgi:hypothetical protein